MGWKECDRVSERLEFVRLASSDGANVSELCRRFGISRKTGYKWLRRFANEGLDGLQDRSRRPLRSPGKTSEAIESEVVAARREYPSWSGYKLRKVLLNAGGLRTVAEVDDRPS